MHRLNVPARDLGAFPRNKDHFLSWAQGQGVEAEGGDFLPRGLYGEYLEIQPIERYRWTFMFVGAPLRVPGGTGSPLNPLAIF